MKVIHCLEMALGITSSLDSAEQLVWVNFTLAQVFSEQGRFEDAQTHLGHAKSDTADNTYPLAYTMDPQARV